jgi:hypothetical protein
MMPIKRNKKPETVIGCNPENSFEIQVSSIGKKK